MTSKIQSFAFAIAIFAFSASATAAPIWIERRFLPDAELIDPVFDNDAGDAVLDHGAWSALLSKYAAAGSSGVNLVDYVALAANDRESLAAYITSLEETNVSALTRDGQLAFWINLYNAATVRLIIDNLPIDSIRDIDGPWKQAVATVNGVTLTLNDIEHGIIRPVFNDNRIHYAVNCASIGCPNLALTAWTGEDLDERLNQAARDYVNHPRGIRIDDDGDIIVSKIYGWYREDFGDSKEAVLNHIRQYAEPVLLERLGGADNIDAYRYDWSLNQAAE